MKFLIDECLSLELAKLARERGFPESSHVRWLGLAGAKDHMVTRRAVDDGYVLVTHNTTDFRGLYRREELHVGLVAFNTAPGLMSLDLQHRLFHLALSELGGEEAWNEVLEITVDVERTITIERFNLPTDGPPRSFPAIGLPEAAARTTKKPAAGGGAAGLIWTTAFGRNKCRP
ncbi:DUF5615 family PIN-like protein [Mesorhizobium sp. M0643]|uniref:DUF5615 family PIN-like protein n=1 Tax=Mesorhizobium sp. M0643 TaxID=2956978 RepID=UPI003336EE8C